MKMIEIVALDNGAHRNQTFSGVLPDGWAVDRDNLCVENFPFGVVEAEEIAEVMTVTKWIPGTMPEPEPAPESKAEPTEREKLRADIDYIAALTGVML